MEFGPVYNQTVEKSPKLGYVGGAKMIAKIGQATPSFVDEKVAWQLRVLIELEDLASRLIESPGSGTLKGGFYSLAAGLPNRKPCQKRERAGGVLKPRPESLDDGRNSIVRVDDYRVHCVPLKLEFD
jgi:hypothetical protein